MTKLEDEKLGVKGRQIGNSLTWHPNNWPTTYNLLILAELPLKYVLKLNKLI